MARCNRCNRFLWFSPRTDYCDDCYKEVLKERDHQHKILEENRRKAEEEKKRMEEQERKQEEAKKYISAIEKNMDYIRSNLDEAPQSCLRLGEFRVSFWKGNGIRILLDPFSSSQHWFHVIGVMRYEGYAGVREVFLCGDLGANERAVFDPFWIDGRGRIGMKDQNAQLHNYDLFELFPNDGEVNNLFGYALMTYLEKHQK